MARLASDAIMGFYPTDITTIKKVCESTLSIMENTIVCDPCCGEGDALASFKMFNCAETYGIELDILRAKKARSKIDYLLNADALMGVRRNLGWAGIVFLNPPYGLNGRQQRLEIEFVKNWGSVVAPGGVMILVINPSSADEEMAKTIRHLGFEPLASLYDEDNLDYQKFGQFFIVLKRVAIGFRGGIDKLMSALQHPKKVGSFECDLYTPQVGKTPPLFKEVELPSWKQEEIYGKDDLDNEFSKLMKNSHTGYGSIEVPNDGQSALLIASGVLNKEVDGLILKGTVEKFQVQATTGDKEDVKVKLIDCYRTVVVGLDTKTLEFVRYE